ncbi:amino acid adenylation domain-containing protein [Thermophilibacter immobilis]|uniref:Amino acid adenylation domain-containing protein n=1 Tax=Thermophilibacter immobilis TaxID=2779519 RepID=A0A7S7RTJ7_9ACTN|nr:amino acid adenylation domain-containing protein [Thermophilibacter immobilis]QOY60286.1 amino acid adenylation domain-containing protein [Thermophilibacter immobilis]
MSEKNALLAAIEKTARERPETVCYRARGAAPTTYGTLWSQATALASALADRVPGQGPVIVLGHKEALTVAAFLGCLMSGHAYAPVDVELPTARVRDIASQIPHATLLATCDVPRGLADLLPTARLLDARALVRAAASQEAPLVPCPRERWVTGDQTQYVIFTSGSTGRPKGIEVTAANVANFTSWLTTFPVVADGGRVFLDQAHYSFDLSVYELAGALATGGCLHAVGPDLAGDFPALFSDLATSGIEVWVSTPSFVDLCLADKSFDARLLPRARLFLFCGEVLHHTTVRALRERFPEALVTNTYGPTESTVAVTYAPVTDAELADPTPLSVGRPRPGTELRITDPQTGAPVPEGATGEIVICGDTVARGYYESPQKTAAAFFDATLVDGTPTRAYRTGDLGHLDERGMLYCEGRLDALVKLNGYRIEPGEVEGALEAVEGVAQAAVVPRVRAGRTDSLVAFVTCEPGGAAALAGTAEPSEFEVARALKELLAATLPAYMVPRRIRVVDALPLTANEKVDRAALAASVVRRR